MSFKIFVTTVVANAAKADTKVISFDNYLEAETAFKALSEQPHDDFVHYNIVPLYKRATGQVKS